MAPFPKAMRVSTLQGVNCIAASVRTGRSFVAKPISAAFLAMIVGLAAFSAAIATADGAVGLPHGSIPADRVAVAADPPGDGHRVSGGLTVKEKTHSGCHAGASGHIQEAPDLFAVLGGKADRLAASVCELIFPAD